MIPIVVSRTHLERKNQEEHDAWRGGEEEEEEEEEDDDDVMVVMVMMMMKVETGHSFIAVTFSTDPKTSSRQCLEACWQDHAVSRVSLYGGCHF